MHDLIQRATAQINWKIFARKIQEVTGVAWLIGQEELLSPLLIYFSYKLALKSAADRVKRCGCEMFTM